MGTVCGYTLVDDDGDEYPCGRSANSWRWYQDVEHEDCLSPACDWHENEGGRRMHRMTVALERVEKLADRWYPPEQTDDDAWGNYGAQADRSYGRQLRYALRSDDL